MIDGNRVGGGDPIRRGVLLTTDDVGAARFALKDKLKDCDIRPDTAVEVLPAPHLLLSFQKGTVICTAKRGGRSVRLRSRPGVFVTVRDAIFATEVRDGQVVVRAAHGFLDVQAGPGQDRGQIVGPGGKLVLPGGRDTRLVEPFDPTELALPEQEAVRRMRRSIPRPDYRRPKADASEALTKISQDKRLRVVIDDASTLRSREFVTRFTNFLVEKWDVAPQITFMPHDMAAKALTAGEADLAVAFQQIPGAASIPFFGDEGGLPWALQVDGRDGRFETALRNFLEPALHTGEYGRWYRDAFHQMPTYEAVRSLVFPAGEAPLPPPAPEPPQPPVTTSRPGTTGPTPPPSSSTTATATSPAPTPSPKQPGGQPAPAPVTGYEVVRKDSVAPAGGSVTGEALCPAGKVVLAGGAQVVGEGTRDFKTVLQGSSRGAVRRSNPPILSWAVTVRNEDTVNHTVGVFAVCSDSIAGYEVVQKDVVVAAESLVADTALCPTGKVVLGGGASIADGSASEHAILQESSPGTIGGGAQSLWFAAVRNTDAVKHAVRILAVCSDPIAGYEVVRRDLPVAAGGFVRDTALCPSGKVVVGGGGSIVAEGSGDFRTLLQESVAGNVGLDNQSLWLVALRNTDKVKHTLGIFAVCTNSK